MATKKRFYQESERKMEARDSMMISEDRSAIANLPQSVMYKPWPKSSSYESYSLNDTISGIDQQMGDDVSGAKRNKSNQKY